MIIFDNKKYFKIFAIITFILSIVFIILNWNIDNYALLIGALSVNVGYYFLYACTSQLDEFPGFNFLKKDDKIIKSERFYYIFSAWSFIIICPVLIMFSLLTRDLNETLIMIPASLGLLLGGLVLKRKFKKK